MGTEVRSFPGKSRDASRKTVNRNPVSFPDIWPPCRLFVKTLRTENKPRRKTPTTSSSSSRTSTSAKTLTDRNLSKTFALDSENYIVSTLQVICNRIYRDNFLADFLDVQFHNDLNSP